MDRGSSSACIRRSDWKPLTALNRYRGLQAFFTWVVAEGELDASPMAGMNPPHVPDEPPPVLTDDELRRLLKSCEGRDFADRRDAAILRLSLDTGARVAEAAGIMLPGDLDLDDQVVSSEVLHPLLAWWACCSSSRCWRVMFQPNGQAISPSTKAPMPWP